MNFKPRSLLYGAVTRSGEKVVDEQCHNDADGGGFWFIGYSFVC